MHVLIIHGSLDIGVHRGSDTASIVCGDATTHIIDNAMLRIKFVCWAPTDRYVSYDTVIVDVTKGSILSLK